MMERPYEIVQTGTGPVYRIRARGTQVMREPLVFRGTAFTQEERAALGLVGLLPHGVTTIDSQTKRVYAQYVRAQDDLAKNVYLTSLRDRNEVLFYRLLSEHVDEMLPIIYTPTIGQAIERYSHEYRRPRGVFLSIDHQDQIEQSLANFGRAADEVDLIVATDSEGILGIGDQGIGGIEIAIGKLTVYIAAAGIHPRRVIPVVLDVGTDNHALLTDPMYLGNRHARVRGQQYDEFIDAYVRTAGRMFPNALLHWEDFGVDNARRILDRYADEVCTFNDDMQGTAAVALAAAVAAVRAAGSRMRDQRVVIHGPGTAGVGIADFLREAMARDGLGMDEAARRIWLVGRRGVLTDDMGEELRDFQVPYARPAGEMASDPAGGSASLAATVAQVHPTVLIGTSTQSGAFTEAVVREMAGHVERPIIFPLSNPTARIEAQPADLLAWTDGRALVSTGSPFPPVVHDGVTHHIAQANNALVFPGLGLGVTVARARRISQGMIQACADAVAGLTDLSVPGAPLLPAVSDLRRVSAAVAVAVAVAAADEGLAQVELDNPVQQVHEAMWQPVYPTIEAV
ncbi:NAD-dependent malic enzyme [Geodermatophilus maliterrae]|uniref:NAD-dependent malic enzyme n=1 Tax=Geodermatophilus maliterrae TaxID=3162531 RepID=A0ABV3XBK4_9ACTN